MSGIIAGWSWCTGSRCCKYYNLNTFHAGYCTEVENFIHFLWFLGTISRTTAPILDLFVLIWMQCFMLNPTMAMKNLDFNFFWKSCKIFACHLHSTSTWRGLIFRCWWNAAICWFIVNIHYCYSMWNGMQLYMVNISLCHPVLHFLSLQNNETALHLASASGHDKLCQVLLQAGADVQAISFVSTIILILSILVTVQKLKILFISLVF